MARVLINIASINATLKDKRDPVRSDPVVKRRHEISDCQAADRASISNGKTLPIIRGKAPISNFGRWIEQWYGKRHQNGCKIDDRICQSPEPCHRQADGSHGAGRSGGAYYTEHAGLEHRTVLSIHAPEDSVAVQGVNNGAAQSQIDHRLYKKIPDMPFFGLSCRGLSCRNL